MQASSSRIPRRTPHPAVLPGYCCRRCDPSDLVHVRNPLPHGRDGTTGVTTSFFLSRSNCKTCAARGYFPAAGGAGGGETETDKKDRAGEGHSSMMQAQTTVSQTGCSHTRERLGGPWNQDPTGDTPQSVMGADVAASRRAGGKAGRAAQAAQRAARRDRPY
jgi:hypothetical protein